ncbi:hypothetical protein HZB00_01545 [Candidatus Woesearchaeota archaeon]|nr:hypothetical protein [Candidatus Woesearchaeota archaeon]
MKTITIKMHEKEAKQLDLFVKRHNYNSKSEFIRNILMDKMETNFTEESLLAINKSILEIKEGKTISLEELEKEYGL